MLCLKKHLKLNTKYNYMKSLFKRTFLIILIVSVLSGCITSNKTSSSTNQTIMTKLVDDVGTKQMRSMISDVYLYDGAAYQTDSISVSMRRLYDGFNDQIIVKINNKKYVVYDSDLLVIIYRKEEKIK